MAKEKEVRLEGAPDWYGTPLDELEFEWSAEEKLEIERYCEKILKNVAEEEMTPLERWNATWAGKPRDRQLMFVYTLNTYATRTLDSAADALKPIDVFRNPKLYVKAHLATVARFALDFPNIHTISYSEDLWGSRAKMIEYGTPCAVGDPPVRSIEDLEGLEVPDPYRDGLYPGYLWAMRELRGIFDEYGLTKVMPLFLHTCCGPMEVVMLGIMGWTEFLIGLRKNPELCQRCVDLGVEWNIKIGQAIIELARADAFNSCQFTGGFPLRGNEWIADKWKEFGKALRPYTIMSFAYSTFHGVFEWYDVLYERGAMSTDCWDGGTGGYGQADYRKIIDWHREHGMYISIAPDDKILTAGPISAIEEAVRSYCEYGKSHPKSCIGIGAIDYWTPQHHVDAAVAAAKKYGKY